MAFSTRQRRMRFEIMEENARKGTRENPIQMEFGGTKDEVDMYSETIEKIQDNKEKGLPVDFEIPRKQLELVAGFLTPIHKIMEMYINVQKGRGNAEQTIKHYEQSMRKLYKFLCWENAAGVDYDSLTDTERYDYGRNIPYACFENDNFDANFREFLLEEEGVAETTVATYFRDYKAIAYWMMDEGLIKKRTITIRNVEPDIKEVYTNDEITRLIKKPKPDCSFVEYRTWVMINWLLATGNRASTITNIKIKDVDFEDNMININVQKNKRKMRLPLEQQLRKILIDYINEWLVDDVGELVSEYLFPSSFEGYNAQPLSRHQMYKCVVNYNKSRGVFKMGIHLFRHTYVKNWILGGGDLHSLQLILGHSSLNMVIKYANIWGSDLKPKVETYSLLANVKGKPRGKSIIKKRRK